MMTTQSVLAEVQAKCERQDAKWGEQNHEGPEFLDILAEEFGEAAKEVVEIQAYNGPTNNAEYIARMKNLRTELIQMAAVCVSFVETLERNNEWLYHPENL